MAFEDKITTQLSWALIILHCLMSLSYAVGERKFSQKSQRLARVHTLSEISLKTFKINTQL